jgi:ABC-type Fe3+/spermidine/putrescine transport system ATPase subunit
VSRPLVDVRLDGVATAADPPPYLVDISVHARYGEFFTFLGPPHSGKTAILRVIAGFMPLAAGRVIVDGKDMAELPPKARDTGYVFHEGALWPHMTVAQHVAFGLEQQGIGGEELERRIATVTTRLGLADARDGRPPGLTTDQRRRLALARALAPEPRVLLLDEPLAHLDPLARKTLRLELAKLHRDLAVTTICATRDAADALALSDRIAVVADGRVLQVGDPEQVYQGPVSRTVAEALGPANFLPVRVVEVRDLGVVVETERGDQVPVAGLGAFREGSHGLLVLRPETLSITEAAMARGPGITGHIALRIFEGARYVYEVDIGLARPVRVERPSAGETRIFRLGDRVRVEFSSETVVLVPPTATSDTVQNKDGSSAGSARTIGGLGGDLDGPLRI